MSRIHLSALALGLVVGIGAIAAGCAPQTSTTQLWKADMPPTAPPMRSVVVFAGSMDEANRRSLEDTFVAALAEHGVSAIPSHKLFPNQIPESEQAKAAVRNANVDGVLTATFKGIREKLTYYSSGYYPGGYYYVYGYGGGSYAQTDLIVNLETTLWDTRAEDRVVWAALTATTNPSSGRSFVKSVTEEVVPQLASARLIAPKAD